MVCAFGSYFRSFSLTGMRGTGFPRRAFPGFVSEKTAGDVAEPPSIASLNVTTRDDVRFAPLPDERTATFPTTVGGLVSGGGPTLVTAEAELSPRFGSVWADDAVEEKLRPPEDSARNWMRTSAEAPGARLPRSAVSVPFPTANVPWERATPMIRIPGKESRIWTEVALPGPLF